jgi:hypothetical protein
MKRSTVNIKKSQKTILFLWKHSKENPLFLLINSALHFLTKQDGRHMRKRRAPCLTEPPRFSALSVAVCSNHRREVPRSFFVSSGCPFP